MPLTPRHAWFLAATLTLSLPMEAPGGDFLFQWDNDKIADTDRHYTNGMRLSYVPDEPWREITDASRWLARTTWFWNPQGARPGFVMGQDMYTPEDVDAKIPDPRDRPYAGWSYIGLTVQNEVDQGLWGLDQLDTLEIDIGIVGPEARAGETQNWFHRQINVSESQGWDSQIGTEPGLLISRTVKLRAPLWEPFGRDEDGNWGAFDAIPHATAQLGNIKIGAAMGGTLRFGGNLKEDFGPIYGTFALPRHRPQKTTWSLYMGAEVRAVGRDIFLDGNTFKDSPDVKRNPFVLEHRAGIATHVPLPEDWSVTGVRLDISHVMRTREFETQDKADRYGSLRIGVNF